MKQNIKKLFSLAILNIIVSVAYCQSNSSKPADKLFDNYLYSSAIYKYEGIKKKDTNLTRKLAQAYRLTSNPLKAELCYRVLDSLGICMGEDLWNYAEMLKMNKKYIEALAIIDRYDKMQPGEKRAKYHLADNLYYNTLIADTGRFLVKTLDFNSSDCEYGPSYYNAQIVFVSSRPIYSPTEYNDGWSGKRFTNLFAGYDWNSKNESPTLNSIRPVVIRGGLSTKYNVGPASFSRDGLTMVFTRNSCLKNKQLDSSSKQRVLELCMSKLDVDGKWRPPVSIPFNSLKYNVGHPSISPDGKTLYFISDMPGGFGGTDIYKCTMTNDGVFGEAVNMGDKINTEGDEMYPFIHEKNVLFFASNGHAGLGGLDLFYTKISGDKAAKIVNLGGSINSSMDDYSLILDISMKRGFFSSNRLEGKGSDDIYGFDVLIPFAFNKIIHGTVKDKENDAVLTGAIVKLFDSKGAEIATTTTNESGFYSFDAEPDQDFSIKANKENFLEIKKNTSTKIEQEVVTVDLKLDKMLAVALDCKVTDKKDASPIDSVHIVITDRNTNAVLYDAYTDEEGKLRKGLEKTLMNTTINYHFALDKKGYVGKTIDWSYRIYKEEEIKVYEYMDFTLGALELGADLGKLLNLKPIYFDIGKWDITPSAALELDKIVAAMTIYPNIVISLNSHTDCRGDSKDNQLLSLERAEESEAYIISRGIHGDRITGEGMGESKLVNECACEGAVVSKCSEEEHAANRRTEFLIVGFK